MRRTHRLALIALAAPLLVSTSGCAWWWFSGTERVDRTRPVALLETTGGVEYAATTEFGILSLGRTATSGPCRVRYFLGPTPTIEDGTVEPTGSVFARAVIDLQTQNLRALDHSPEPGEPLIAMWTPDGVTTESVDVQLARADGVGGDVLADPGCELPPGAAVFATEEGNLRFCGLVTARATVDGPAGRRVYFTFAGIDRVRELMAVPELHPVDHRIKFRPDDITVRKPLR